MSETNNQPHADRVIGVTPVRPSFAPRNWLGWVGVAFYWLLGWAPRPLGRWIGRSLGALVRVGLKSRRRIVERNLERCFPEWSAERREQVERACFGALGQALVESAWCWCGAADSFKDSVEIRGLSHVLEAEEAGRGVLVVSAHFTCLEIGGRFLAENVSVAGVYRRLKQPVLEWYHTRGRLRYGEAMIDQKDIRTIIRHLRQGGIIWYAPDQDFGPRQSLFAPFFNVSTATLLATHRLPKMTGCAVVFMVPLYDRATNRYVLEFSRPLENYPGDDPAKDLARINGLIEEQVRGAPEQYWWVHRRFKTRPPGEAPFYE